MVGPANARRARGQLSGGVRKVERECKNIRCSLFLTRVGVNIGPFWVKRQFVEFIPNCRGRCHVLRLPGSSFVTGAGIGEVEISGGSKASSKSVLESVAQRRHEKMSLMKVLHKSLTSQSSC